MTGRYLKSADFYAGLSDADVMACTRDVILYGEAFVRIGADGQKRHVPREYPGDHPPPPDALIGTDLCAKGQASTAAIPAATHTRKRRKADA